MRVEHVEWSREMGVVGFWGNLRSRRRMYGVYDADVGLDVDVDPSTKYRAGYGMWVLVHAVGLKSGEL